MPFLETLIPIPYLPYFRVFSIKLIYMPWYSTNMMKIYEEIGSPCLIPFSGVKGLPGAH